MRFPLDALKAGVDYLRRNPTEIFCAARHAAALRVSIPLDALRWLADRAAGSSGMVTDVVIGSAPPAITMAATIDLMGAKLRSSSATRIDELRLGPDELRVSLRVSNLSLEALGGDANPMSALLKSGALDLANPGSLMNFMPSKPEAIVEASGDRIVLDLLKVPKIAGNEKLRRILALTTPVIVIYDISTDDDHLLISWRPRVTGVPSALRALAA
jgi:hypothetical protein